LTASGERRSTFAAGAVKTTRESGVRRSIGLGWLATCWSGARKSAGPAMAAGATTMVSTAARVAMRDMGTSS
jgi:hypothetical protein